MADCQDLVNSIYALSTNIREGQDNITTVLYSFTVDFNIVKNYIETIKVASVNSEIDLANIELVMTSMLLVQDNILLAQQNIEGHLDNFGSVGLPLSTLAIESELQRQQLSNIDNSISPTLLDNLIEEIKTDFRGNESNPFLYSINTNLNDIDNSIGNLNLTLGSFHVDILGLEDALMNIQYILSYTLMDFSELGIAQLIDIHGTNITMAISSLETELDDIEIKLSFIENMSINLGSLVDELTLLKVELAGIKIDIGNIAVEMQDLNVTADIDLQGIENKLEEIKNSIYATLKSSGVDPESLADIQKKMAEYIDLVAKFDLGVEWTGSGKTLVRLKAWDTSNED